MKAKRNSQILITTVLCLLPIALGMILYNKLPDQIAVHFNSSGTPDNYLPKIITVFGLPVVFAIINLFTHFRLNHDPRSGEASFRLKLAAKWALPLAAVIIMPITLFLSMGAAIPLGMIVSAIVGLVIVIAGNYLPKCRQNYTVGIKLPWTLHSEDNWNKTHRLAGFVWVVCGLLLTVNAFLNWPYVSIALLAVMVIVPPVYSYLLYRKQEAARS